MSRPKYSTTAGIFEKRGDPWVTGREGREKFGRNLDTEDPDFDRWVRAKQALPRPVYIDPPKPKREKDYQRIKTNIILKARLEVKHASRPNPHSENPFERFCSPPRKDKS